MGPSTLSRAAASRTPTRRRSPGRGALDRRLDAEAVVSLKSRASNAIFFGRDLAPSRRMISERIGLRGDEVRDLERLGLLGLEVPVEGHRRRALLLVLVDVRCRSAICLCTSCSDHSWCRGTSSSAIATSMAAPLTKNAVRTTFVSGRPSTIRRFGCQAGTSGAVRLTFFRRGGRHCARSYLTIRPSARTSGNRPPSSQGRRGRHLARPQPRDGIDLQRGDAERRGEGALEPRELRRKLDADDLPTDWPVWTS
jgi:hypothetical protein